MDPFNDKNFISTKEASELSGYHSDYLSRLCREGKVESTQVGRMWFVSRDSLTAFVKDQAEKKREFAESLAREREREYRAALQVVAPKAPRVATLSVGFLSIESARAFLLRPSAALVATALIMVGGYSLAQANVVSGVASIVSNTLAQVHEQAGVYVATMGTSHAPSVVALQEIVPSEEESLIVRTGLLALSMVPPSTTRDFTNVETIATEISTSSYVARVLPKSAQSISFVGVGVLVRDFLNGTPTDAVRSLIAMGDTIASSVATLVVGTPVAYDTMIETYVGVAPRVSSATVDSQIAVGDVVVLGALSLTKESGSLLAAAVRTADTFVSRAHTPSFSGVR
ncbi:MAG: helix-turn-helix domain-containing protein, partial [Patescibacteria group bacterium]